MSLRWSLLLVCSCVGTADMVLLPAGGPVQGVDAGSSDAGASVPSPDAGMISVDSGTPPFVDAGSDAGLDAGGPGPCGALDTRLISAQIDVAPASVEVGSSFGWSNNRPVDLVGDVRLAWDGATIAPMCLSDCYRAKGVLLNDSDVLQDEPSGNCGGSSNGELGGLAAISGGGFGLTFSTREGRANRDVGFIAINSQQQKSPVVWLTGGTGDESAPHLAQYGAGKLLASWRDGTDSKLAVLSAAGAVLEGPITAPVGVADRDDFTRWPSGDVGWAEGAGSSLHLTRVRACTP